MRRKKEYIKVKKRKGSNKSRWTQSWRGSGWFDIAEIASNTCLAGSFKVVPLQQSLSLSRIPKQSCETEEEQKQDRYLWAFLAVTATYPFWCIAWSIWLCYRASGRQHVHGSKPQALSSFESQFPFIHVDASHHPSSFILFHHL
jgi:hypothetical protein